MLSLDANLKLPCSGCEHPRYMHSWGGCEADGCVCRYRPDQCNAGSSEELRGEIQAEAKTDSLRGQNLGDR